jgi:hypothetical protein
MVQIGSSQGDGGAVTDVFSVQVPITALPKIQAAITESGANWMPRQIRAQCVSCEFALTGTDLEELATAEQLSEKLERVKLQYCARRGCDGRFYRVSVSPAAPQTQAALESLALVLSPPVVRQRTVKPETVLKVVACVIAGAYLLFLLHHLYFGERVPLFQQDHHFEAQLPPR